MTQGVEHPNRSDPHGLIQCAAPPAQQPTVEVRSSKDLERLVARLERLLAPTDAVSTSPDYLPDKITDGKREVDVSIKSRIGSSPILMTLECRERARAEDVTWIEQLAAKRNSVGVDKAVAVSSFSFSEPAITKATFHGIEIRRLEDITHVDTLVVHQLETTKGSTKPHSHGFHLGQMLIDGNPTTRVAQSVQQAGLST